MNKALALGFFQFDNLLRNRVPFALLKSQFDLESAFGVMEKMHLRTHSMPLAQLNLESAEAALKERGTRKEDPVVIICETGEDSQRLAQALADQDYLNVYYVLGGWKGLQDEMRLERT
jgi:rhodanese-related sulfurtransferase